MPWDDDLRRVWSSAQRWDVRGNAAVQRRGTVVGRTEAQNQPGSSCMSWDRTEADRLALCSTGSTG
jgi:hypothetical protein